MAKGLSDIRHESIKTYRIRDPEASEETCLGNLKQLHQSTRLLGNACHHDQETRTRGPSNRAGNCAQFRGVVDTGLGSLYVTVEQRNRVERNRVEQN